MKYSFGVSILFLGYLCLWERSCIWPINDISAPVCLCQMPLHSLNNFRLSVKKATADPPKEWAASSKYVCRLSIRHNLSIQEFCHKLTDNITFKSLSIHLRVQQSGLTIFGPVDNVHSGDRSLPAMSNFPPTP